MKSQAFPDESGGLTLRAALIAVGLSLFLLTSSSYIALKLGALPWPIIFSVIVSGGLIKVLNRHRPVNIHEVNVAQAGASIGGLVAAGVVFTLPGIMYLNQTRHLGIAWPDLWLLSVLVALSSVLGVLLSVPLKYTFIDEEQLPYPAGTAGAELLKAGKSGGRLLVGLAAVGCLAGVFALTRDLYFPSGWTLPALAAAGVYLVFVPMPLAVSGGYILGPKAGYSWFAGAAIGWLVIVPFLFHAGWSGEQGKLWVQNLGMGMVLGSGVGFFAAYVIPRLRRIFLPLLQARAGLLRMFPVLALAGTVVLVVAEVPPPAAVLAVLGVWIMVAVAARMTGETNINPLEQFGIFVGLVIAFLYARTATDLPLLSSFLIVLFVSVASAVAGDAGHDYKSAAIVGTRFFDIVKIDVLTAAVSGLVAPLVLEAMRRGFAHSLFTPAMPAPQAQLVAGSIFGFEYPKVFLAGFILAFSGEMLLPQRIKERWMLMPMGIGLFLGMGLAIPLLIGAMIRHYLDKRHAHLYHAGLLIAAGVMGGEGIAGFTAGALTAVGWSYQFGARILLVLLALGFAITAWQYRTAGRQGDTS